MIPPAPMVAPPLLQSLSIIMDADQSIAVKNDKIF